MKIDPALIDGVIFDMDGVIVDTAELHFAAWKQLFDGVLSLPETGATPDTEFTHDDYLKYVDGRQREDGVIGFLSSRNVFLPAGESTDADDAATVAGLSKRKNQLFLSLIDERGIAAFESSRALVKELHLAGIRVALVSASRNTAHVLDVCGISDMFPVRVDGLTAAALHLVGKPDPAIFLEAARQLNTVPERTAIVEDAISGVRAGRFGGFGLVIGVSRRGTGDELVSQGATWAVQDLAEVDIAPTWSADSAWSISYDEFDPELEQLRESLCTLGNGRFATRGAAPESRADGVHYPGTYAAGVYNRLTAEINGREVENESIVNLPDWQSLRFKTPDGDWFIADANNTSDYHQVLDFHQGILSRSFRVHFTGGQQTMVRQRRIVSMADPYLAAMDTTFVAENWSGQIVVRSGIDARVNNDGVSRYVGLGNHHLNVIDAAVTANSSTEQHDCVEVEVKTNQSDISISMAARHRVVGPIDALASTERTTPVPGRVTQDLVLNLEKGSVVSVEKVASLFTSRDRATSGGPGEAIDAVAQAPSFSHLVASHARAWQHLWTRCDLAIVGDDDALQKTRLHIFHLLQTVSPHSIDRDVGIPARGLHGEAYRGHIFWDELFIFPFLTMRLPEVSRSLLRYRWRRLPMARKAASEIGLAGAMFPWQSGSDGSEETQQVHLNPRTGEWLTDNSHLQRHVGISVAYNAWQFYQFTGDKAFLSNCGAELMIEVSKFWSSLATFDATDGRYDIRGVMGPDEFHDAYPWNDKPGIDNNAYTNVMAAWLFTRTLECLNELPDLRRSELLDLLEVDSGDLDRWKDISKRLRLCWHDGLLSQFEDYDRLKEFDWDGYRKKYGSVERLDRILNAEGDSTNRYRLSKQADVLMLFYVLSNEELEEILTNLGYSYDAEFIPRHIEYYANRTSHGSTLSKVVHAWVLARSNRAGGWNYFLQALASDISDDASGSTREGIHLGAMAGTVDLLQRGFTGLEVRSGRLRLNPRLPREIEQLDFRLCFAEHDAVEVSINHDHLSLRRRPDGEPPLRVEVRGTECALDIDGVCKAQLHRHEA